MDKKVILKADQNPNGQITIKTNNKTETIDKKDIKYIEANRSYATIWYKGSRKFFVSKPLACYERKLGNHNFVRCHNSFLVNINQVETLDKMNRMIKMTSGDKIPVSRRKLKQIAKIIEQKLLF